MKLVTIHTTTGPIMVNANHIIYVYQAMPDGKGNYNELRVMLTDTTELTLDLDEYLPGFERHSMQDFMDEFRASLEAQLEK